MSGLQRHVTMANFVSGGPNGMRAVAQIRTHGFPHGGALSSSQQHQQQPAATPSSSQQSATASNCQQQPAAASSSQQHPAAPSNSSSNSSSSTSSSSGQQQPAATSNVQPQPLKDGGLGMVGVIEPPTLSTMKTWAEEWSEDSTMQKPLVTSQCLVHTQTPSLFELQSYSVRQCQQIWKKTVSTPL